VFRATRRPALLILRGWRCCSFRICNIDQEWSCDSHLRRRRAFRGIAIKNMHIDTNSSRVEAVLIDRPKPISQRLESRGCWSSAQLENRRIKPAAQAELRNFQRCFRPMGLGGFRRTDSLSPISIKDGLSQRHTVKTETSVQAERCAVRRGGRNHAERRFRFTGPFGPDVKSRLLLGLATVGVFVRLKNSARSRRTAPSVTGKFRSTAMSKLCWPGPRATPTPLLPKPVSPGPLPFGASGAIVNAFGSR